MDYMQEDDFSLKITYPYIAIAPVCYFFKTFGSLKKYKITVWLMIN